MATGLLALLDDIAGIAKVAAASVDDVIGQAAKAGVKAAGVVIDDAAVTPRYVVGFAANRELPIVGKIAVGSLKNKLIFLLPAALILSLIAPWAITPLLVLGGAYLCYEGTEKVYEAIAPQAAHHHEEAVVAAVDARNLEDEKVTGAIRTDFILSAEIMAITLASLPEGSFVFHAVVLALVGIGITGLVYGGVALIVKADDGGAALAARQGRPALQAIGRGIVRGMPVFLRGLSIVGTAAMIWVGGGIIIHGLQEFGLEGPANLFHDWAVAAGDALEPVAGLVGWLVSAALSGIVGLIVGAALIPLVQHALMPGFGAIKRAIGR